MLSKTFSDVFKFGTTEGAIKAWETRRNGGAGFASPNREEGTQVQDAVRKLTSGEQIRLQKAGGKIDRILGVKSSLHNVIGAWEDGAENSTLTRFKGASYDQIEAAMAMRGLLGEQKSVITFRADHTGPARLTSFTVKDTDPEHLHNELVKEGLKYHTLESTPHGTVVHIFEDRASEENAHTIRTVAAHYGARADMVKGKGRFLGSWTSRSEGRKDYEKVINDYFSKPGHQHERQAWERTLKNWKFGLTKLDIAMGVQL